MAEDWLLRGTTDSGEVTGHYDEWAERYDADLASWSYDAPAVVAARVQHLRPHAETVLDVGCGTGLVGRALRRSGCTGAIAGLDISRVSLDLAARTGAYGSLAVADLQQPLPVPDDEVEVLVCVGVMTYLPDTERVWRELTRVVRPGGLVALTQREDLWVSRGCAEVVEALTSSGRWVAPEVSEPASYLPETEGGMAEIGIHYLTVEIA